MYRLQAIENRVITPPDEENGALNKATQTSGPGAQLRVVVYLGGVHLHEEATLHAQRKQVGGGLRIVAIGLTRVSGLFRGNYGRNFKSASAPRGRHRSRNSCEFGWKQQDGQPGESSRGHRDTAFGVPALFSVVREDSTTVKMAQGEFSMLGLPLQAGRFQWSERVNDFWIDSKHRSFLLQPTSPIRHIGSHASEILRPKWPA